VISSFACLFVFRAMTTRMAMPIHTRLLFAGIISICQVLQKAKQELACDAEGDRHPQLDAHVIIAFKQE